MNDLIEIPKEIKENNNKLVLCVDNMFVNNMPMFTSIDKTVRFRALVLLNGWNSDELFCVLDVVLRKYNGTGYEVEQINCDWEFKKIMDEIKDELGVSMSYTGTDKHVPEANHQQ